MKLFYYQLYQLLLIWLSSVAVGRYVHQMKNLPSTVVPFKYDITLKPNLNESFPTLLGHVTITLLALYPTNSITLHAVDLDFDKHKVTMKSANRVFVKILEMKTNRFTETCTFFFEEQLEKNRKYDLSITYSGRLRNDNSGFYLGKYKETDGTDRLFASTFFTKQNARSAFPCFDEPDKKAQFVIKVMRPKNYSTISNEERISTENLGNGYFLDVFNETVNMSTYLVAFTVSQFKNSNKNGIHQIFARPQIVDEGKTNYALRRTSYMLESVEEYLGMKYELSKITHVLIPDEYFATEALENWGHISYNEEIFLFSNKTSTSFSKQQTITCILHELIHQWFGNLVTPSEWKYLWLSEGFATYLQFRIGDLIEPSWKLTDQFQNVILERAFEGEASFYETSLNEDRHVWVAYIKAASIIRMIEHFLTPDIFRKGLHNYLKINQYSAVNPLDLYEVLQSVMEKNSSLLGSHTVADIMRTWDSARGYPYVNVTRDYETGYVTFEQDIFAPNLNEHTKTQHIWYIPINYVFNAKAEEDFDNTTADFWLVDKKIVLNTTSNTGGWLIVNKQFSGYYRVMYDLENWNRLISFLNSEHFSALHLLNRAQLINDAFDFAKRGRLNYAVPLNLSMYLSRERNCIAFSSFFNAIELINTCLSASEVYPKFKDYIFGILKNIKDYLGFNENINDTYLDKLNRVNVIKWLCSLGNPECRETTLNKLRNWIKNKTNTIPLNLHQQVLCGALRTASKNEWNLLFDRFDSEESEIRTSMLKALSCSESEEIIRKFLNEILNPNNRKFTDKERTSLVISILESGKVGFRVGTSYIRQYFYKCWELIEIESVLNIIGSKTATKEEFNELIAFKNQYIGVHMAFRPGIRLAEINLVWSENYLSEIKEWLNTYIP